MRSSIAAEHAAEATPSKAPRAKWRKIFAIQQVDLSEAAEAENGSPPAKTPQPTPSRVRVETQAPLRNAAAPRSLKVPPSPDESASEAADPATDDFRPRRKRDDLPASPENEPDAPPGDEPRRRLTGAQFEAPPSILDNRVCPIDLPTSLRLAGLKNAELLFVRERIAQADAARQLAASQLLPDLNVGGNYDHHVGPLQRANGEILEVTRSSLYSGLGASAVGGGTVTIPGIVWSNNVSDVFFDNLVARQVVVQRQFATAAARNDILLRVATAYVELQRAEGRRAVAVAMRSDAEEVARVTANYAAVGQGRQADADRAATELERRNADLLKAESDILTSSARLCQLLNLDPSTRLHAADGHVVPVPIVPDPAPLCELIAIAVTRRPELGERRAAVREALITLHGEKMLPFSPNVIVGYSTGQFGGGSNLTDDRFGHFDDRQDFDAVVYWTLRNLGAGNLAQIKLAGSRVRASQYQQLEVLDRVRSEVAIAHARAHARYAQIGSAERAIQTSQRGFKADLLRTRNREGLPIEVLNSLNLLGRSRVTYLDTICDYNRAQFELFVALGQPPAKTLAWPVPDETTLTGGTPPEPPARREKGENNE